MKKIGKLVIFTMLMAISSIAQAEVKAGSFSLTPFAGGYFFEGNQNTKNAVAYGVRAGYNFTSNWGLEGFYQYVPTKFDDSNETNKIYVGGIEGLFHFMPEKHFVPYVAIGVGAFHFSDNRTRGVPTNFAVDYGAGMKIFITDDIALRADVRHILPLNDRYNDLLVSLGITFSFGGKKKEIAARVEEPPAPVASPKIEEPVAPAPPAPAPVVAEPVAPKETAAAATEPAPAAAPVAAPVVSQQSETKTAIEEEVKNFINKWLSSWQSGDMETYRSCYVAEFQSKGMDLDAWVAYKNNVRQKSKDISIRIDDLKISADGKTANATAIFNQYYSSSMLKDSVKKTLNLKKISEQWKIYKETIAPLK